MNSFDGNGRFGVACSRLWNVPVFRAEDCLQLKLRTQPHVGHACPVRTPPTYCIRDPISFCNEAHVTLHMASCDDPMHRGTKEADNIEE